MKSKVAFWLTAERLFKSNVHVYFWTFTFAVLHSDTEASKLFTQFLYHLRRSLGGDWGGVRVAELHKEHGVHFHALINRRLAVDWVRRIGKCHGIGRIHVCKARRDAVDYLGKYLTKQREGPRHEKSGRRMRRWAAFGPVARTRVSDLVNDSPMWVFRRKEKLGWLGFRNERLLQVCWNRGEGCFRSAWFAARRGETELLMQLSQGIMESKGNGFVAERAPKVNCPF